MEHLAVVRQNSIWPLAGSLVVQWIDTPKALRLEVLTPDIIGAVVSPGTGVGVGALIVITRCDCALGAPPLSTITLEVYVPVV